MSSSPVALFVTGHGFGHGARAAAIAGALLDRHPGTPLHFVTDLPPWFFRNTLGDACTVHPESVDVGMVQTTAVREDLPRTLARLDAFYPLRDDLIDRWAGWARNVGIETIVADIAPLGIAVGKRAGIRTVLVENFTWAFVYGHCADTHAGFARHAADMQTWVGRADLHLRTRPMAGPGSGDRVVGPIARPARCSPDVARRELTIEPGQRMVLVSMGGTPWSTPALEPMPAHHDVVFVIAAQVDAETRRGNVIFLPPNSRHRHPDLVNAADVVVGKAGYSTVAEVYHAGVPLAFVSRPGFPEAPALEAFAIEQLRGMRLDDDAFSNGSWVGKVVEMLGWERMLRDEPNGAEEVVEQLLN